MFDLETFVTDRPRQFMITTLDNPYNPYHDFDKWYLFDEAAGYRTCEYIDRLTFDSDTLSDEDNQLAMEIAMEEILDMNLTGNYIKIYEDTKRSEGLSMLVD